MVFRADRNPPEKRRVCNACREANYCSVVSPVACLQDRLRCRCFLCVSILCVYLFYVYFACLYIIPSLLSKTVVMNRIKLQKQLQHFTMQAGCLDPGEVRPN
jgi:hypothetical protein